MRIITSLLEDAVLAACDHFNRRITLVKPAHQINIVGQHIDHRRCMRRTLEDREGLRTRVINPRRTADHTTPPTLHHLFLGAQETLFESPAITNAQIPAGLAQRFENIVGVGQRQCDGFLHHYRLAQFKRMLDRRRV